MMSPQSQSIKILVLFILSYCCIQLCVANDYLLKPNHIVNFDLPSGKYHRIFADATRKNGTRFMLQLHSQVSNMTLCNTFLLLHQTCTHGNNVGMYDLASQTAATSQPVWLVLVNSTEPRVVITANLGLLVTGDPLPGGCNQVFNIQDDPSVRVTSHPLHTHLWFQWANRLDNKVLNCESQELASDLHYDVYVYYLDAKDLGLQSYLDGVSGMLTASDIQRNGQKVTTLKNTPTSKPEIAIAAEPNRGKVFSILVRSSSSGFSAPYVTVVSYGCRLDLGQCSTKTTSGEIIVSILCLLVGLFLLLLGHRMFSISQFVCGFLLTFVVVFILMHMSYAVHRSVIIGIAGCAAVIGGALCLAFWHYCFFPIASVLVPGLSAGYLVAATVFFTPFGNIKWWNSNENYAPAFICVILFYAVLLMAFSKLLSIVSSSLLGSYMTLMVLSVPLSASLRLVYLYSEYRQTEKDFNDVFLVAPLKTLDIVLLALWPVLLVGGVSFQYYRDRGRPAFQRSDFTWTSGIRWWNRTPQQELEDNANIDSIATADPERQPLVTEERRHLLHAPVTDKRSSKNTSVPSYQSVQDSRNARQPQRIC